MLARTCVCIWPSLLSSHLNKECIHGNERWVTVTVWRVMWDKQDKDRALDTGVKQTLKSYNHICQNYSQFSISLPACSKIRP